MKRILPLLLLFAFAFFPETSHAQAYQATPVTVSTEKVRIGGKLYYSHKVLEKQTLYSISKAYGATIEDIIKANPSIGEKGEHLRAGTVLLIPAEPSEAQDRKTSSETADTVKTAAQAPPGTPEKSNDTGDDNKDEGRFDWADYSIHTVKWYENLQSIARKYGMSEELLVEFNGLESTVLRKRQKIKIPDAEFIPRLQAMIESGKKNDRPADEALTESPAVTAADTVAAALPVDGLYVVPDPDAPVRIALVLPLDCIFEGSGGNTNYMDFYSGALVAAKNMSEKGVSIELNVIDTQEYNSVSEIAESGRLDGSDYVIGPVHAKQIQEILPLCKSKGIDIVSPLDPKAAEYLENETGLIQVPLSANNQYEDIAAWIQEEGDFPCTVLVLAEVGGESTVAEMEKATRALQGKNIDYKVFSYNILQGRGVEQSIGRYFDSLKTNRVIIASENEAFVNDAVRNLNTLRTINKYDIHAYGTARLRGFETIEPEHFHNINMHLSMAYYVDYGDPETMEFLREYRALFNAEPTPFAFQGYDIFTFFTAAAAIQKQNVTTMLEDIPTARLLQSDMKFRRGTDGYGRIGGYENTAARRIVYGDNYNIAVYE